MKQLINAIKDYCTYNYESIAVAENITTGCLQMLFGSVDEAATYFQGGITTLNSQQLSTILGIEAINNKNRTELNMAITIDMAKAVAGKFESDIGIAINGCHHNHTDALIQPSYAAIVRFNKVIYAEKLLPKAQASSAIPIEYAQRIIYTLAEKLLPQQEEIPHITTQILEPLS